MRKVFVIVAALGLSASTGLAQAPYQQSSDRAASATQGAMSRPAVGMGSKTMDS